jgi:hypothetical protein
MKDLLTMFSMDGLVWWWVFLAPMVAAATLWIAWREHRLTAALRQARSELQSLSDVLDVWQWRSDTAHHLVLLRPPHGAAPGDWLATPANTLWDALAVRDVAALRAQLACGAPLDDIPVARPCEGGTTQPARLRGRARYDERGLFIGYAGTLRDCGTSPPEATATTAGTRSIESDPESFSYTVSHDPVSYTHLRAHETM